MGSRPILCDGAVPPSPACAPEVDPAEEHEAARAVVARGPGHGDEEERHLVDAPRDPERPHRDARPKRSSTPIGRLREGREILPTAATAGSQQAAPPSKGASAGCSPGRRRSGAPRATS